MQIKAEDEELERLFTHDLQHMVGSQMSKLEPRQKLDKLVLPKRSRRVQTRL